MASAPPEATRYLLPAEVAQRQALTERLQRLYASWGYVRVEVPALEPFDPAHPRAAQSFKLSDLGNRLLALRSDFTPAIAALVRANRLGAPLRLQYGGALWQAIDPDIARIREFSQVGLELIGVSNARADAELIHLARESVREVGLTPRVEVGNPGFVRALFELAGVPAARQAALADAIDRKDPSTLRELLKPLALSRELRQALLAVPDLYGDAEMVRDAKRLAPWAAAQTALERLERVLAEFEDASELLVDLGMARRLSYYTGITFRAYTPDFGQPLLGGGRYDGALLPHAAGFALGLERLLLALPDAPGLAPSAVLSLDDAGARRLRRAGFVVERALSDDPKEARAEASARGIPLFLGPAGLERISLTPRDTPLYEAARRALEVEA